MTVQKRVCVECREIYGCVIYGRVLKCNTCPSIRDCNIRSTPIDAALVTGGFCDLCWSINRANKEESNAKL